MSPAGYALRLDGTWWNGMENWTIDHPGWPWDQASFTRHPSEIGLAEAAARCIARFADGPAREHAA